MQLTRDMAGDNPHFKAERAYMGERRVYVHLLVFTQFGMHRNEIQVMQPCALCQSDIRSKCVSLCVRIMGGTSHSGAWEYAMTFAHVCGTCKPSCIRKYAMILLKNADVEHITQFVDAQAFGGRCVEVDNFLCGTDDVAVYNALIDNYLYRLNLINAQVPLVCRLIWDARACFFCKEHTDTQRCVQCKCVSYCNGCVQRYEKHHANVCNALSSGRLFHVDAWLGDKVYHVERGVAGRCLRYKPETLKISQEDVV